MGDQSKQGSISKKHEQCISLPFSRSWVIFFMVANFWKVLNCPKVFVDKSRQNTHLENHRVSSCPKHYLITP
jgi:hypothetical protein